MGQRINQARAEMEQHHQLLVYQLPMQEVAVAVVLRMVL
jgi:hypothetical protein